MHAGKVLEESTSLPQGEQARPWMGSRRRQGRRGFWGHLSPEVCSHSHPSSLVQQKPYGEEEQVNRESQKLPYMKDRGVLGVFLSKFRRGIHLVVVSGALLNGQILLRQPRAFRGNQRSALTTVCGSWFPGRKRRERLHDHLETVHPIIAIHLDRPQMISIKESV